MPNTVESRDEVARMAAAIRAYEFVSFNDTAGLHVHVGRGKEGFSLATMQKFVTLLLLGGEETLSLLHRASRRDNDQCYSLATKSFIARHPNDAVAATGEVPEWVSRRILDSASASASASHDVSENLRGVLEKIWKAGTLSEFCELLERGLRLAYSINGLRPTAHRRTIEFRQAEGTLEESSDLDFLVPVSKFSEFIFSPVL